MTLIGFLLVPVANAEETPSADLLLVVGAPGTEAYHELFERWADRWSASAQRGKVPVTRIGHQAGENGTPRDLLQRALDAAKTETGRPLWIVLIGHGTYDRRTARFNLHGPDVAANEFAEWLHPLERPVAIVDCSACSAPFLTTLSAKGRVVITATKTGGEENFARFGEYLSQAIADPTADLDKDDQTSLWEAYLAASRQTAEFYQANGRLQTEHALLDDNGDKQGTRADLFRGLQLQDGVTTTTAVDGLHAHQWHLVPSPRDAQLPPEVRRRRDELELQIIKLRDQKSKLPEDEYYNRLETLLVELAKGNTAQPTPPAP